MNDTNIKYNVVIIGGGASGLMCASYLKSQNNQAKILIIERNTKLGNKLFATGNGRCNLSNLSAEANDYQTDDFAKLVRILDSYPVSSTLDYFENTLGLQLVNKGNLVYPYSLKSSSVVDSFELYLKDIDVIKDSYVTSTIKTNDGFRIITKNSEYYSDSIVFACGGSAAPKTGSDGNIYKLLLSYSTRDSFTRIVPSLVQIKTVERDTFHLSGTRVQVDLSLFSGHERIYSDRGEMLFTDYGISGICVFNLSGRYNRAVLDGKKDLKIIANLLPDLDVHSILAKRIDNFPNRSMNQILMGFFTKELSDLIVSRSSDSLESVVKNITEFTFNISGTMGYDNAQVTSGGLNLSSVSDECMLADGVYVIGEAINVDGPCGGYNLQWAWSSAMAAADSINRRINNGN